MLEEVSEDIDGLKGSPRLEVIIVGESEASESFISEKKQACKEVGAEYEVFRFGENLNYQKLMEGKQYR